jgi:hypothetical protein
LGFSKLRGFFIGAVLEVEVWEMESLIIFYYLKRLNKFCRIFWIWIEVGFIEEGLNDYEFLMG